MQNYKFLNHIALCNVFFAIICIPTAGKLIDIMGIPLSMSIYYFPFVYVFGDILTEVYGYTVARRVLWYCVFAQVLVIAIFEFVVFYPPSAVMTNNQSYVDVLSAAPRLVLFGTLAMFTGDIANNYVLAKMKVWTSGRYISGRFVVSHCVIPAGGLSLDHTHWIQSRSRFFLSIKVLRRVFRGKFVAGLKQAFQSGRLSFSGNLAALAQPKTFAAWLRSLFRKDWVVYAKPPFGGPQYVLQYLGRYTHRVAISNHRLASFTEGKVTFRWRDSAHNNEQKLFTVSLDEFLRRFLLHLLPKGFVRIRNFGFLANRRRATFLPLCFHLLGEAQQPQADQNAADSNGLWRCPKCGGPMVVVERLTAAEIQLRSPPLLTSAA